MKSSASIMLSMTIILILSTVGSLMLKLSYGFTLFLPTLLCLVTYSISFYLFSKAVSVIGLALGYAIWSGAGTALNALASYLFFHEPLGLHKIIILTIIILGIILINQARIPNKTASN